MAFITAILEGTGGVYKALFAVIRNFVYVVKAGALSVPPTGKRPKLFTNSFFSQNKNPFSVCIEQVQVALSNTIIQKIGTDVKMK